ncbi:putative dehydrogenase [Roseimicrobium gellanilyticum]|uniref:Putative dehydrogenase n=1 Tax=Roseimicrobium gellanilyticum TaxID=748857 RepID=A0A366HQE7_9BACT|nr:Gfo/Idh/MocA family oxidoreductase [Roseimicrobium gellanilyticum]RBP45079.1 putative dehydrogenase [Roseimicrobium gellanilyticum]
MNTHTSIKRRDVLRSALYAGTAMALPIWSRAEGSNSDIRVAVIGFKGRGSGHIGSLQKIKGVRLVALCDVDSDVLDGKVADLKKKGIEVKAYTDFRKLCEDKDIDAVTIATPNHTHTLIAMTAIAAGKHVYVEKPTNHNLWEGAELVKAAAKVEGKQIVVHGMQRRSDLGWAAAQEYIKSGALGKTLLSRGVNYKARQSIGKVSEGKSAGADGTFAAGTFKDSKGTINYDLWAGPREMAPVMREKFHYDWHWQWAYGNGDIGNQGPHQLDVARWMIGNPEKLPVRVMSFGNRWGYTDDGQTANNQMALYDYGKGNVPILFDNRGLPRADMNWQKGNEPAYKGTRIGNIIHCEGGYVAESKAYDNDGKWNQTKFEIRDGPAHMDNFIASIRAGKLVDSNLHVNHGFQAASLAILSNISYRLGKKVSPAEVKERLSGDKFATETFEDFAANLQANKIDIAADQVALGPWLSFNPDTLKFEGEFAEDANKLAQEEYRKGFELPKIG